MSIALKDNNRFLGTLEPVNADQLFPFCRNIDRPWTRDNGGISGRLRLCPNCRARSKEAQGGKEKQ